MDGYATLLWQFITVAFLIAFTAGALVRWRFLPLTLGLLGLGFVGVAFYVAIIIGAPPDVLLELVTATTLALLPFIAVAVLAGRAFRKVLKRNI